MSRTREFLGRQGKPLAEREEIARCAGAFPNTVRNEHGQPIGRILSARVHGDGVLYTMEVCDATPAAEYARLLKQSHDLIGQGQGDSPEAEALADQMDAPWRAMTTEEQEQMRRLSVELYDAEPPL